MPHGELQENAVLTSSLEISALNVTATGICNFTQTTLYNDEVDESAADGVNSDKARWDKRKKAATSK